MRREERKATLLFGVTRASSAWVFPIRHQPSLCTVAKASAIGLGAPSICDLAAGLQRGVSDGPTWFAQFPESDCEQLVMFCGAQW